MTNKHREQSTLLTNTEVILEMSNQRIPSVDPTTASGSNKKNFDRLRSALGFIPNMALAMAQSPAVLDGYMSLSGALTKGRLGKRPREELALTLAASNRCEYCASAHTSSGKLAGLKETDVAAALQGKAEDVREAAADSFRHRSGTVDIAKMDLC
jgi:AhpD family alkylhydroperoxidase